MQPKVSVCITTYNHEKFIAQALDSVLKQKTDFDFEILVGEDDSSDNTREIVKEYARKHPDKIRLFLNDRKDVIYIDGHPTGRWNFMNNIKKSEGEYISLLDGDDYWIDDAKLQKQVDYLQMEKSSSFCFGNSKIFNDTHKKFELVGFCEKYCKRELKEKLNFSDIVDSHWIPTGSVTFRASMLAAIPEWFKTMPMGDWGLFLLLLDKGPAKYFDSYFSVYRIHENAYWSTLTYNDQVRKSMIFYEIVRDKFSKSFNKTCLQKIENYYANKYKSENNIKNKFANMSRVLRCKIIRKTM